MRKYHKYDIAMELQTALKERFGGTSLAKLRKLTIRFDTCKKQPKHNMRHLREMSNMISELNEGSHELTNKQISPRYHMLFT